MLMPLLISVKAQATIYKCVKANSDVYYNDKPCPVADVETELSSVKDPVNGYIPPDFLEDIDKSGSTGKTIGDRNVDESNEKLNSLSKSQVLNGGNSGGKNPSSKAKEFSGNTLNNQNQAADNNEVLISENQVKFEDVKINKNLKLNVVNFEPIRD